MQRRNLPLNVSPSSFLPPAVGPLVRPFEPMLTRWLFPDQLLDCMPEANTPTAAGYASRLLSNLDIHYDIQNSDLNRIPKRGRCVLVCNHPFGFLEGLILLDLLEKIRIDYRIVANGILANVPALHERMIFVDPFGSRGSRYENGRNLRSCVEWLSSGGLLVVFPAGEVAHLTWGERPVADPKWNRTAARLAIATDSPTLPLFFAGTNSPRFQIMGALHPRLRTLSLANELARKRSETIRVRIGSAIPSLVLKSCGDAESATEYLRARTYLLLNRSKTSHKGLPAQRRKRELATQASESIIQREIEQLSPERVVAQNEDFTVCLAGSNQIPNTLREIGRLRELTFRDVGEGTGRELDLDEFDSYYQHLVLWNVRDKQIAGGYRLIATPDVLPMRGVKGLYTSTLFHYQPEFFEQIGPAIELGRSFICRDYQKHYAPLLLLWKGITRYVQQRPECPVLFGAVSVSSDYHSLSRTLIVNFLNGQVSKEASDWIRPRKVFRETPLLPKPVKQLARMLPTLDELSSSIQDLEPDGKGLPVLIRQYLKVGGKMLGCNVDPGFSHALDVLLMADLRTASSSMLERCMGQDGAANFRAFHGRGAADGSNL